MEETKILSLSQYVVFFPKSKTKLLDENILHKGKKVGVFQ